MSLFDWLFPSWNKNRNEELSKMKMMATSNTAPTVKKAPPRVERVQSVKPSSYIEPRDRSQDIIDNSNWLLYNQMMYDNTQSPPQERQNGRNDTSNCGNNSNDNCGDSTRNDNGSNSHSSGHGSNWSSPSTHHSPVSHSSYDSGSSHSSSSSYDSGSSSSSCDSGGGSGGGGCD